MQRNVPSASNPGRPGATLGRARRRTLVVAGFLAAAAAPLGGARLSIPSGAQDPQGQKPTFRTAANLVRVDVYPTANGRIVPDLTLADFELLEDGVLQKVDTIEHVTFRAPGPEAERREPRTVAESTEAASDPNSRLFVLFLDSYHTPVDATTTLVEGGLDRGTTSGGMGNTRSHKTAKADSRIGRPLARFLERLIGADDLIGLMRPEMSIESLSFTRRPSSFEEFLQTGGFWQREGLDDLDATERLYKSCYPNEGSVVAEMIARRREHMVLDSLHALVARLRALREGRKALLVVSQGWPLFKPSGRLTSNVVPSRPAIGVEDGRITMDNAQSRGRQACDTDRSMLADLDDQRDFKDLLDEANRANVTFYPIHPAGLAVTDAPFSAQDSDNRMFRGRLDALLTLASATDGIASLSNDFAKSFQRIADDMSSYYLLGYYSTNAEPDGKFRQITVRVKRPGVSVRARRGYRAATRAELAARSAAAMDALKAEADPVAIALERLATARVDAPVHARAGYGWRASPAGQPAAVIWVVGELDQAAARHAEWQAGGTATITLSPGTEGAMASADARLSDVSRAFMIQLPSDKPLPAGPYTVAIVWRGPSLTSVDSFQVSIPPAAAGQGPWLAQPLLFRRGPFTGLTYQPTADPRFRRQERLRVDLPVAGVIERSEANLLDRAGRPLPIPITVGGRDDGGAAFIVAELPLAPLAPGDYLVEISVTAAGRTQKIVTAFRVVT